MLICWSFRSPLPLLPPCVSLGMLRSHHLQLGDSHYSESLKRHQTEKILSTFVMCCVSGDFFFPRMKLTSPLRSYSSSSILVWWAEECHVYRTEVTQTAVPVGICSGHWAFPPVIQDTLHHQQRFQMHRCSTGSAKGCRWSGHTSTTCLQTQHCWVFFAPIACW